MRDYKTEVIEELKRHMTCNKDETCKTTFFLGAVTYGIRVYTVDDKIIIEIWRHPHHLTREFPAEWDLMKTYTIPFEEKLTKTKATQLAIEYFKKYYGW